MRAARARSAVVMLLALGFAGSAVAKSRETPPAMPQTAAIPKGSESAVASPAATPRAAESAPKPSAKKKAKPAGTAAAPGRSLPEVSKAVPPHEAAPPARRDKEPDPAPAEPVGPGAGQGERKIRQVERSEVEAAPSVVASTRPPPARKGRPPKHPSPSPPDGAAAGQPDDDARRQIAGGPTADDLVAAKPDVELRELREAERALFPKPLRGARATFSWDLPAPVDDGSPAVVASGLPPGFPLPSRDAPSDGVKEAEFLKGLMLPNLPTRLDARVVKYLKFYRDDPRGRSILRTWAKKCGRLVPALRAELAKGGLPTDLVWLSLIESGHNPTIVSPVGAAGLWQFMPESARLYGLTVDRWVDERLDPERSTEAAVRYLSDLRTRFGSWELAMAAYNMGHGGLLRAVRKFNTNDFWALSRYEAGLPWETTLYVPKILATAIVMANKKAFGIEDVEQDAPISFDTVFVGPGVDLAEVARAADVPVEDVRGLNAEYLSGRTPPLAATPGSAASGNGGPRRFPVHVPAGRGLLAEQRLASANHKGGPALEPHVVRFGDTLETIAAEHGAVARDVAQLNHVTPDERLAVGSVLLVPAVATSSAGSGSSTAARATDPPDEEVVVVPARRFVESKRKRVFYRVLPGDQISEVAAAFGATPSELAAWNAIDPAAELQPGMALQVLVRPECDLSRVRCLAEHEVKVLVAGSAEFFDYFEAQNGRKRLTVVAKKGDTYAAIGRRYGMSATMMERINRVPSTTPLAPGDRVVVYTKGEAEPGTSSDAELASALAGIAAPFPDALPPVPAVIGSAAPNGQRAVIP